jgi:uncharacterized protein (DUF427 family)
MDDDQRGGVRVERSAKRVRAYLNGVAVADTTRPLLVWEKPYYPAYYLPVADVRTDLFVASDTVTHSPIRGDAVHFNIKVNDVERVDAVWQYNDSPIEELRNSMRFDWSAMDGWFEEDEEVIVHPRDPHKRVDILPSSRSVRIELDGVMLADTTNAHVLHETSLPPRWYIPKTDVRMDLFEKTDTVTRCPYKGQAEYWSVRVGDRVEKDLAWSYPTALPESQRIVGLVAFWNERVDIVLDGARQPRPKTPFH